MFYAVFIIPVLLFEGYFIWVSTLVYHVIEIKHMFYSWSLRNDEWLLILDIRQLILLIHVCCITILSNFGIRMSSKCKMSINEKECWGNPGVAVQIAIRNTHHLKTMGTMTKGSAQWEAILQVLQISAPRRETSNHCYFPLSIHPSTPPCFHLRSLTHASFHLLICLAIHPYGWPSILSLSHTHTITIWCSY